MVICEGAGSPAEINLLDNDIVNLGLAQRAGIPAVLVGDIHRGGVFAHLYGTVAVLPDDLRPLIRAFIINMFRGDPALLGDAMEQLEAKCGVPTLGVMPYLPGLVLDAEDSLHRMLAALTNEPDRLRRAARRGRGPPAPALQLHRLRSAAGRARRGRALH